MHVLYWADQKFWTVSTDALTTPAQALSYAFPGALDTSTSGGQGLWSDGSQIRLINIAGGQISIFQTPGQRGHFSPDDQRVIYISGSNVGQKGQFVRIRETDDAGSLTNVAGRGSFTAVDWRN